LKTQKHFFHLVTPSPWPFLSAMGAFILTGGAVLYMHSIEYGLALLALGFSYVIIIMSLWFRDVIRESFYEGSHTKQVQTGLRLGMLLFIISEIMFFFSFFFAFFYVSASPSIWIGSIWPPNAIEVFNPWEIPLLNTLILLWSGLTITSAHHNLIKGHFNFTADGMLFTLYAAQIFLELQFYEYIFAPFSIYDGIYGSTFFMTTGFHGFHVLIGSIFILICYIRLIKFQFNKEHHVGFEAAIWYWHFVDVVWLFLFISIYWWGGA
jgi:cytochrome c oxidase subunit 3